MKFVRWEIPNTAGIQPRGYRPPHGGCPYGKRKTLGVALWNGKCITSGHEQLGAHWSCSGGRQPWNYSSHTILCVTWWEHCNLMLAWNVVVCCYISFVYGCWSFLQEHHHFSLKRQNLTSVLLTSVHSISANAMVCFTSHDLVECGEF